MIPYLLILLVVMLLLALRWKSVNNYDLKNFAVNSTGLVLMFFAGLRSSKVGVDTGNYVGFFNRLNLDLPIFNGESSKEVGFTILQYIAKSFSDQYWSLLILIAVVAVYCNLKTFAALSINFSLSVFLYITLGVYLFVFNGARQAIAAAIIGIALIHLIHRRLLYFILFVFAASLFHRTALLVLPFYYILTLKFNIQRMVVFAVISFVALLSIGSVLSLFDDYTQDRYSGYENRGATGGGLLALYYIGTALFLIYVRKFISLKSRYLYDFYLNLTVFTALIYLVVTLTGADVNMIRLTLYFTFGNILIWPMVLGEVEFFKKYEIRIAFYVIHLAFFIIYLTKMKGYVPYLINPYFF